MRGPRPENHRTAGDVRESGLQSMRVSHDRIRMAAAVAVSLRLAAAADRGADRLCRHRTGTLFARHDSAVHGPGAGPGLCPHGLGRYRQFQRLLRRRAGDRRAGPALQHPRAGVCRTARGRRVADRAGPGRGLLERGAVVHPDRGWQRRRQHDGHGAVGVLVFRSPSRQGRRPGGRRQRPGDPAGRRPGALAQPPRRSRRLAHRLAADRADLPAGGGPGRLAAARPAGAARHAGARRRRPGPRRRGARAALQRVAPGPGHWPG